VSIYANGRYSSHQTTDLNEERLAGFLTEAVAITGALEPDSQRRITPPELYRNRPADNLDLTDDRVNVLDRDQRLAWCATMDESARQHERVISASSRVRTVYQSDASVSSNGFSGMLEETACSLGASVTLRDRGDRRASDGFTAVAHHVDDIPDPALIASTALERAVVRLDAHKGPTVNATMIVDSRAAARLIGSLLGPANARSVQQGRSFWGELIGEQAFSDKLTIVDDPLIVRGLASRHFDDEGISARVLPLVSEGVVENIYVDTYYGGKAGMTPTTGSASNRVVKPGDQGLDSLLADANEGVYVTSWLGGNADSTTGDFSLGIGGHMIENGRIGRPVGEMNVTGNLKDLFSRLEAIGNDPYPYATTLSPSLVFSDVDFSGA
jgi:PmbA protein